LAFVAPKSGTKKGHLTRSLAMAGIAVMFGGMTGFISAVMALVLFNASWLLALGLWSLIGMALAGVLIALSLGARRPRGPLAPQLILSADWG
jgi:hypothetical protein